MRKSSKPLSTRASTVKSTFFPLPLLTPRFGVDARSTDKPTRVNNKIGPGHYENLEKKIFKSWIKAHSPVMLGRFKGWKKVKDNGVPGAGNYDHNHKFLKSQIKFSCGTGKRARIFDGKIGPGPHHQYEIDEVTKMGRIPHTSRTCRKKQCKNHMGGNAIRASTNLNDNPGPGTYDMKFTITKPAGRKSSMGARSKAKKFKGGNKQPSPVSYDPIPAFRKLKAKYAGRGINTGIGFATSGRTKTRESYFQGPGDHQVRKKIGGSKFT